MTAADLLQNDDTIDITRSICVKHRSFWQYTKFELSPLSVDFHRGQERFEVFDTKMNQLMGTQEAQMQRVSIRLDEMDTRLGAVAKIMEESAAAPSISEPAAPLLGEFATRGVLSTLKVRETNTHR